MAWVSDATVQRTWAARGLPRVKRFMLSRDPKFGEQLEDIVGLYLPPSEAANS